MDEICLLIVSSVNKNTYRMSYIHVHWPGTWKMAWWKMLGHILCGHLFASIAIDVFLDADFESPP